MRCISLIACMVLAGCGRHALPFTRAQVAAVQNAVQTCTSASGALTPLLRSGSRAAALNASAAARNTCSSARAAIVTAVGTGTVLDACYYAVDRQEAVQRAELASLDTPTLENGKAVVAVLDEAIRQQTGCSTVIEAAGRGG
jgi:transcription elongation factor